MNKNDKLWLLRKALLDLQENHLDLLCSDLGKGETSLEIAFGSFLYRIDEEIRAIEAKKKKKFRRKG